MLCYAVFHNGVQIRVQIRVYPYDPKGNDWQRARTLAIELAEKNERSGYKCLVEHFGVSGVGTVVWM
jgi:hypothetical protein